MLQYILTVSIFVLLVAIAVLNAKRMDLRDELNHQSELHLKYKSYFEASEEGITELEQSYQQEIITLQELVHAQATKIEELQLENSKLKSP